MSFCSKRLLAHTKTALLHRRLRKTAPSKRTAQASVTTEDDWLTVACKKVKKPFDEFLLRGRERSAPTVLATQLVSHGAGVALVNADDAEHKVGILRLPEPLLPQELGVLRSVSRAWMATRSCRRIDIYIMGPEWMGIVQC